MLQRYPPCFSELLLVDACFELVGVKKPRYDVVAIEDPPFEGVDGLWEVRGRPDIELKRDVPLMPIIDS